MDASLKTVQGGTANQVPLEGRISTPKVCHTRYLAHTVPPGLPAWIPVWTSIKTHTKLFFLNAFYYLPMVISSLYDTGLTHHSIRLPVGHIILFPN